MGVVVFELEVSDPSSRRKWGSGLVAANKLEVPNAKARKALKDDFITIKS